MNLHHLELFYYVAKHEGITAALPKMPYGIQQPAVSSQIQSLEKNLGVKLFHRRPFTLTTEGAKLYDYIYPFFSKMGDLENLLKQDGSEHLRIAASAAIMRHHLPKILNHLKTEHPELRLTLQEVEANDITKIIQDETVDIAITTLHDNYPDNFTVIELIELPMALLIPKDSPVKTLEDFLQPNLWDKGYSADHPLITAQNQETLVQTFQQELEKRQINWQPSVQLTTLELVRSYAEQGFGAGLTVVTPGITLPETHRYLILKDFPTLKIGVIYRGKPKNITQNFINLVQQTAGFLQ